MKRFLKLISLLIVFAVVSMCFCSCNSNNVSGDHPYIKVGDKSLSREYIGYFFYLAQRNMIQEAGMTLGDGGNSTKEDVISFWETTEIEGKSAVNVARDTAADNAVIQTVQYLKAVDEGIELTNEDEAEITAQIKAAIESSGGEDEFIKQLQSMNCDEEAYKQILTENKYLQKLYDKYDSEGLLSLSDDEMNQFMQANIEKIPQDQIFEAAKKDKFNKMVQQWESEYTIEISNEKMKEFEVK